MTPDRWAQIEELFHRAAECDPNDRVKLLDEACAHDLEMRHEVEGLLSWDEKAADSVQDAVRSELAAVAFPLTGETISHYRIVDGLGGGGMGLVYRAEDLQLGRWVALKFLPDESAKDPAALGRFEREARSASALEHPNICPIYEFGDHNGQRFLAMQLLEGETLRELISATGEKQPPLEVRRLTELAIQIVNGLAAAHGQGIIHRDIKPANIFVTAKGQAKILDFGLAKLANVSSGERMDSNQDSSGDGDAGRTLSDTEPLATPDPFLSRTGVAMGTAGYMSPEQARGEKLDARTDLFSFGLVLYEMATGKRAFHGDTGPALRDALIKQEPAPILELNPKLPGKLEQIISKALQKDRDARYQTASEMQADLVVLKRAQEQGRFTRVRQLATVSAIVGIIVIATFWLADRKGQIPAALPDTKLRQLTFNSSENSVTCGSISPDGKYLAYTDAKGMHIKVVGTDETRSIPEPVALKNGNLKWEVGAIAWFPDSKRFFTNAHPASENSTDLSSKTSSIWIVSVQDTAPRKVRDNAVAWAVSPNDNSIAYGVNNGRFGEREIWVMQPDGEHARKLFGVDENSGIGGLLWSPDGQRMLFFRTDVSGDTLVSGDLQGQVLATLLGPVELKNIPDFAWSPDGRLIYAVKEPGSIRDTCNYWAMRIDTRTGKTIENPRRLTNWAGFCVSNASLTDDGKSLAFLEWSTQGSAYMANLEAGAKRIADLRHFPLEDDDAITDWSADSKTVIFVQSRGDHYGIYKQQLDSDNPESIVSGVAGGILESALLSPDDRWIMALVYPVPGGSSTPRPIVRIPITGGSPEPILSVPSWGNFFCTKPPSNVCMVVERTADHKQMIVSTLDPINGRGPEVARFDVDPTPAEEGAPLCDISPDGTRLVTSRGPQGPIQILSLRGKPTQVVPMKGLNNMRLISWTADGQSLFVSSSIKGGGELLHVDLQGNATLLWKCSEGGDRCVWAASPDGKHLALYGDKLRANMWMMENF